MTKKLTILDIAKLAGVGKSTVSRVLTNDPKVKPSTREKVERIIQESGYVPSKSAQAMAGQAAEFIPQWAQIGGALILLGLSIGPVYRTLRATLRVGKRHAQGTGCNCPSESTLPMAKVSARPMTMQLVMIKPTNTDNCLLTSYMNALRNSSAMMTSVAMTATSTMMRILRGI